MKKLLLMAAMAAMTLGASADGYKIEKVWEITGVSSFLTTNDARQGFGMNGKFYINDKSTQTVLVVDQNGLTGETFAGGANCGISRDEAGNIIVSNAAFPNSYWTTEDNLVVINPTTGETVYYTIPEECGRQGRCDFIGFAKGNMMEDGVLYLTGFTPNTEIYTDGVAVFTVAGGEVDADNCYLAQCDGLNRDQMTVINYFTDIDGEDALLHVYRSGAVNKLTADGENFTRSSFALPGKGACNGAQAFTFDGKQMFLYPQTPNYQNAFAIAEANADEPIVAVASTVAANPNVFQSNWLNAEVDETGVTIYQYTPGNNITVYRMTKEVEQQWELGDVNHDTKVDVSDVTALIAYILGNNPEVFFATEANVNGDEEGKIDVSDVTALISMILGS